MEAYTFRPMTRTEAEAICDWHYPAPYSHYDLGQATPDLVAFLLAMDYYSALDEHDELVGFYCTGEEAQVPGGRIRGAYSGLDLVDVGMGMRPDLTGQGRGAVFARAVFVDVRARFPGEGVRVSVQTANHRAVRAYRGAGLMPAFCFPSIGRMYLLMTD